MAKFIVLEFFLKANSFELLVIWNYI